MNKLYFIGNAHIDPVWLWRWQEGFSEISATFRSALDRMRDFPDFKFTSACSSYYQWIEETDPDMFEEIRQRVKEGRWNIVGGMFLQPDCNIPDGESFARHILISQRYFQEKFGITVKTGYNVDSFGHNASLPKILRKGGMENYVFMRPGMMEKTLRENVFRWESDDGSSVSTFRIHERYNVTMMNLHYVQESAELAERCQRDQMVFYGVGNHGGGPTIELIRKIKAMDLPGARFSTPDEYFNELDKDSLPVVKEELQHHAIGCYSACSYVKQQNRRCENSLVMAERFCLLAKTLLGTPYPGEKLTQGWKNLLFNQFHDILGGCSIKKAYEDAGHLFGETMRIAEQAIYFAAHQICRNIDTLQGETLPANNAATGRIWVHEVLGTPVVVFNPHCYKVRMPVTVNHVLTKVTDHLGHEIPHQRVRGDHTNGIDKYACIFEAEVEPMGYRLYRAFIEKPAESEQRSQVAATEDALENDRIRVTFDSVTGDIAGFYDKKTGKHLLSGPCAAVILDDTDNDTWAHDKTVLGPDMGQFSKPRFQVIENGPVRATVRVETVYENSRLIRDYSVVPGSSTVTVKAKVDFREKHRVLKLKFPVEAKEVVAKIPYGTVTRPMAPGEEPFGSWLAAGNLCIANDCKYSYDASGDSVRMTVLRSAIYADHFAGEHRDSLCEHMEQGEQEFSYCLFPFTDRADAEREAAVLNFGLRACTDSFHNGKLSETYSGFSCDCDDIIVSAVKQGEDGDEETIRFYEMNGRDTHANITLFGNRISTDVGHHEIKVFDSGSRELDMMEWPI